MNSLVFNLKRVKKYTEVRLQRDLSEVTTHGEHQTSAISSL